MEFFLKKLLLTIVSHLLVLTVTLSINAETEYKFADIVIAGQFSCHALIIFLQVKTRFYENLLLSFGHREGGIEWRER